MQYTRETAIARLIKSFSSCYDIHPAEDDRNPITARCDFFEHSGRYVISKKAELWTADNEEFLYLINIPHLTRELYEKWRDYAHADGIERLHIGPGHMSSYITPVFICDSCDEDAKTGNAGQMPHFQKFSFFTAYGPDGSSHGSGGAVNRTD